MFRKLRPPLAEGLPRSTALLLVGLRAVATSRLLVAALVVVLLVILPLTATSVPEAYRFRKESEGEPRSTVLLLEGPRMVETKRLVTFWLVLVEFVKMPVEAVEAPIVVPLIDPPEMVTFGEVRFVILPVVAIRTEEETLPEASCIEPEKVEVPEPPSDRVPEA